MLGSSAVFGTFSGQLRSQKSSTYIFPSIDSKHELEREREREGKSLFNGCECWVACIQAVIENKLHFKTTLTSGDLGQGIDR